MPQEDELTLMLVEDDQASMLLLEHELNQAGYRQIVTARDGLEAWEMLQIAPHQVDLILLDRYMPMLDGYELLKRLKASEKLYQIPVIMQTASSDETRKRECLQAGAYYYLTKPYDRETLLTVLTAATRDLQFATRMRRDIKRFQHSTHLLNESRFSVITLEDATYVGSFLAHFFPHPERTVLGLTELLINGVEHGNLGISYLEKGELLYEGRWAEEIERRQCLPENRHKKVDVTFTRNHGAMKVVIQDEGIGFEWRRYLEIDPRRATHIHGRGIAIAKTVSFDQLEFSGEGNCVTGICLLNSAQGVAAA